MPERILGMRRSFVVLILIVLYTIAPILSVLLAGIMANSLGCKLDEGQARQCMCLGIDIGRPLYALGVAGWLALVTLPTGLLAMIVYVVVTIASALSKSR